MCGIVAIINKDGRSVDTNILTRMADTLKHRGPDDEGQFLDGSIGFHHQRLSIIDLETGHQPMTSDGVTVVFNGEIYNYLELKSELRRQGHEFRTTSDTEVLLRMYMEYGLDFVDRLNGMFAFVLYDADRKRLVAARDHFGIKPLYIHETESHILYASEIKALLQHPEVSTDVDRDSLHDYLTFQYVLGDGTLFRGIRKLLPGRYQVVALGSGRVKTVHYWDPSFKVDLHHTEEYFTDHLRWLLEDTVKQQMRSDVPVGTYLSGGMDSSIVTSLASREYPISLETFTGSFREGPEFDESEYARDVAARCGAKHRIVYPTENEFIELMPKLIRYMDEPAAGPGLFPQHMVSKLASGVVKVCLGGQGGDEIFGGYARYVIAYFEQAIKGAMFETTEEGEHIVSLSSIVPNLPYIRKYVPMLDRFWKGGLFDPMDHRYFQLIDRSEGTLQMYSPDFRREYDAEAVFSRFQRIFNHPNTSSYYNKMTHYDMVTGLPALLQVEDRMSMAVSLESRVPLLDRRIADLVASMPPAMKFKGAEMKYILKRAARRWIPDTVYRRKDKMGFPVPLHLWARGKASEFFESILLSKNCRERGLFDTGAINGMLHGEAPYSRRLWGLLNVELWHQKYIDAG